MHARQELLELRQLRVRNPELVDALQQDIRVEDAQHPFFAERGRHRRDAQLDLAAVLIALDPAVLRPPLLGDVAA